MPRLLLATFAVTALHAEQDWRAILRHSFARLQASEEQQKRWTYLHRSVRKELFPDGSVKSENTLLYRREMQNGAVVQRLIERNGKPIPEAERKKLEESASQNRRDSPPRT